MRLGSMRYYVDGAKVLYTLRYISKCTLLFQKIPAKEQYLLTYIFLEMG